MKTIIMSFSLPIIIIMGIACGGGQDKLTNDEVRASSWRSLVGILRR